MDATITAAGKLTATSLADITGTYTTHDIATLFAADNLDATVTADLKAEVSAGIDLAGSITSTAHDVEVVSLGLAGGTVSATVTAAQNATVTALDGDIAGVVTATAGDASLTANGEITKAVSAGRDAIVFAVGAISSPAAGITAGRDASVTTFAELSATISAARDVTANAGAEVSKSITAGRNAAVASQTSTISGAIVAVSGDADVSAAESISGDVTAFHAANVLSLDNVTGNVTATSGDATVTAAGGTISGDVTAGASAVVIALGNISGQTTAGIDASVSTFGNQTGDVTAGHDATLSVAGTFDGTVAAGHDADVSVFGNIDGTIAAAAGNATVSTWNNFNGTITSGSNTDLFAGGSATAQISAGGDATLQSLGVTIGNITAAGSADISSAGPLAGSVTAGVDAWISSLDFSTMTVTAGHDASIFTFDGYQAIVHAGHDAEITTLGLFHASITAGNDASVYAVGSALGDITAGHEAQVVTWQGAPVIVVTGQAGAFVWADGDLGGQITSAAGDVVAVSFGNATGTISAGQNSTLAVVGNFLGNVSSGQTAVAVTLGDFNGSVTAAINGILISEGNAAAQVTAGQDAFAYVVGDVTGTFTGGRDVAATVFGDLNATLSAGRDVTSVWTRGNLFGTITAARNIGNLFSYGAVSATVNASNPSADPAGGIVGDLSAWGAFDATITAQQSVGVIRSGDLATVTINAPISGSVTSYDTNLLTETTYPNLPPSDVADVLAGVATAYDDVVLRKNFVLGEGAAFLAQAATAKAIAATQLALATADLAALVASTLNDAQAALLIDKAEAIAPLVTEHDAQEASIDTWRQDVTADLANLQAHCNEVKAARSAAYSAIVKPSLSAADAFMTAQVMAAIAEGNAAKIEWQQQWLPWTTHVADAVDDFKAMLGSEYDDLLRDIDLMYQHPDESWAGADHGFAIGGTAIVNATATSLTQVVTAGFGPDRVEILSVAPGDQELYDQSFGFARFGTGTLVSLIPWCRLGAVGSAFRALDRISDSRDVIEGSVDIAKNGLNFSNALQVVSGALGLIGNASIGCFVYETPVALQWSEPILAIAPAAQPDDAQWTALWVVAGGGLVAISLLIRRSGRRREDEALDVYFAEDFLRDGFPLEGPHERQSTVRTDRPSGQLVSVAKPTRSCAVPCEPIRCHSENHRLKSVAMLEEPCSLVQNNPPENPLMFAFQPSAAVVPPRAIRKNPGLLWLVPLLLAGVCFFKAFGTFLTSQESLATVVTNPADSRPTLVTAPIGEVRIGQRVLAQNPELNETADEPLSIEPSQWRNITLRMTKESGGSLDIELLRPTEWIAAVGAATGTTVELDLAELGAAGPADVLRIDACPEIETGEGYIVTGRFIHEAATVIDLHVNGLDRPIGTTANHPFWSSDRRQFVPAGELRIGERLSQANGRTTHVAAIIKHPQSERVYNLEVEGPHVYHVSSLGIRVHNQCDRHHPIPKFMRGNPTQPLSVIDHDIHVEFHQLLSQGLRARNLPPMGGRTGSTAAWIVYMEKNPGSQRAAFDAVHDAARQIDAVHGTSLEQDFLSNLAAKLFKFYP